MPALSASSTVHPVAAFLADLGIGRGDTVLMHAAFAGLSRCGFRAEDVADQLVDALAAGTIAMPTMSWRAVNPDHPVFDERATPSITGVLTETFRTRCAGPRSLHPTHSVAAAGRAAAWLTADHHRDRTPCGPQSPWGRLAEADAVVVMLGCGMETCTLVHYLEETVAPDVYLRDEEETYRCIDRNGEEFAVTTRRHRKLVRNFHKFEALLRSRGLVRDGVLAGVPAFAFRARDLIALGMQHMHTDPFGTRAAPGEDGKLM
jgi:aminoglycoside 3-N-acetyltransferase